jgi:SAM-dependent methyltransferase
MNLVWVNTVKMKYIIYKIKLFAKRKLREYGTEISIKRIPDDKNVYHENYSEDSIVNRRFYNICAGGHEDLSIEHPFWTNLDLKGVARMKYDEKTLPEVVPYDMLDKQTLPIEDNSAEIILSQYSLEHVTNNAAGFFLKECYRALKEKGIVRIVVPNIELDVRAYKNNDRSYFFWEHWFSDQPELYGLNKPMNQASLEQVFISHFAANASTIHIADNPDKIGDEELRTILKTLNNEDALDYCTSRCKIDIQKEFRYNHINWWNADKLINALKVAGFKDVYISGPNQSSARIFRNNYYFEKKPNHVALTVEAIK